MPNPSAIRFRFVQKLQICARYIPHRELAKQLGIKVPQLQNWLYRDTPKEITAQYLMPKLPKNPRQTKQ